MTILWEFKRIQLIFIRTVHKWICTGNTSFNKSESVSFRFINSYLFFFLIYTASNSVCSGESDAKFQYNGYARILVCCWILRLVWRNGRICLYEMQLFYVNWKRPCELVIQIEEYYEVEVNTFLFIFCTFWFYFIVLDNDELHVHIQGRSWQRYFIRQYYLGRSKCRNSGALDACRIHL